MSFPLTLSGLLGQEPDHGNEAPAGGRLKAWAAAVSVMIATAVSVWVACSYMLIEIEARHTARYGHSPEDVSGWLLKRGYTMHTWRRGWREADSVRTGTRNYLFRASPFSRAVPRPRSANQPGASARDQLA